METDISLKFKNILRIFSFSSIVGSVCIAPKMLEFMHPQSILLANILLAAGNLVKIQYKLTVFYSYLLKYLGLTEFKYL